MKYLLMFSFLLILAVFAHADTGADLRAVAGAHTRVVWIEDNALDKPCVYSERATLRLMGLDSDDGKGERQITDNIAAYWKPIITDDGKQVAFGDFLEKTISVINWDGSGLRLLVKDAQFEDVWTDPRTKTTWVYGNLTEKRGETDVRVIRRYRMDKPEVSELVWDKMGANMFMLSGDGRAASGGGDGGNSPQGMYTLPNGSFFQMAGGCWPSMSPDNSHRMWVFTGNHRSVHFCVPNREGKAYTFGSSFDSFPNLKGNQELYHPRWSNNINFFTLTGPYVYSDWKWSSDVKISPEGAAKVEVYLGKFSADFTKADKWVRISNNERGDYWPCAWIEPDPKDIPTIEPDESEIIVAAPAQPDTAGMVYQYGFGSTSTQIIDPKTGAIRQSNGILRDLARFTRYQVMDLTGGSLEPVDANVPLVDACKASNQLSIELNVTPAALDLPYDAVIIASAETVENGNFMLLQRGEWLVLRLNTSLPSKDIALCKLIAGQPNHLVISYSPDKLSCYLDGKRVLLRDLLHGDFSKWSNQRLIAGDAWTRGHGWAGLMDGFAIFSRVINMPEAQARYAYRQEKAAARTVAVPVVVDAKLVERSPVVNPKDIAPYRRCLSTNRYSIVKVIAGECKETVIDVAQWSVLDSTAVAAFEKLAKDQVYRLKIEKWEDHPEQEAERMMNGDFAEIDASLFLDVTPLNIPHVAPRTPAIISWTGAADGYWDVDNNWQVATAPGKGDSAVINNIATGGKRTIATRLPVNIKELNITQTETGAVNKLLLGDSLTLTGSPKPLSITAAEPASAVVDLNGQSLLCVNGTLNMTVSGTLRMAGNGSVNGVTVINGGYDYVKAPAVSFTGGGGKGAVAEALMSVCDLSMTKVGTGYTSAPEIVISAPEISAGSVAQATAYINKTNGTIDRILITNGGSGYTRAPKVTFIGGGGDGAEVEATLSISEFFISNGGSDYTSMPQVVLAGGSGDGAIVQASAQISTFRYTDAAGSMVLSNSGIIDQNGAVIIFDWAAVNRNPSRRSFENSGNWTMKNGASLQWISSTGREGWYGRDNVNSGTMRVLSGARLGLSALTNTGTFELGDNTLLGQTVFANGENILTNQGNGVIKVLDGQSTFGCISTNNGKRIVNNGDATGDAKSKLLIGDGKKAASLTITGGNCYLNNLATGTVEINEGAELVLATNDNGSSHKFINRDAKFTNDGKSLLAGKLSLQGNHGGAVSIENTGILTIKGDKATFERLRSSCGPGGYYDLGTSARLNISATGTLKGIGALTYVNKTESDAARMLMVDVKGILSPGDEGEVIGKLAFNTVQMTLSGILKIDIEDANRYDTLQLSGAGDTGKLTLAAGSVLNINSANKAALHGKYRIVTAKEITGKFEKVSFNGANEVAYTVNYLPDGVEVVFP